MKLLVFAHRAEAQAFLSKISFQKQEEFRIDYYVSQDENISLTLCNEGVDDSLKNITYLLAALEAQDKLPTSIINMGVAGSVNSELEINRIYSVRTSYRFLDSTPVFKSQSSIDFKATIDCVSTNQRIITKNDASKLQVHADIVDRELWGISKACRFFQIPFESYKLISDYAGQTDCELIADKGNEYSFELFRYYKNLNRLKSDQSTKKLSSKLTSQISQFIDQLSPTFSQRVQLEKLFEACLKRELDITSILTIPSDENYIDWPRKKRNQFIISSLTQVADPVQAKLNKLCSSLSNVSCKAIPNTENPTLEIRTKITDQESLDQLISELKNFPFNKLEDFYQGSFDV